MAVPKRRTSRSNTRHRRSQWKAVTPGLVPVTVGGRELLVPRRLVRAYRRGLLPEDRPPGTGPLRIGPLRTVRTPNPRRTPRTTKGAVMSVPVVIVSGLHPEPRSTWWTACSPTTPDRWRSTTTCER